MNTYRTIELLNIPSGMGGVLPAAVAEDHGEKLQVICLHSEYFNNWLLTVNRADCSVMSSALSKDMKSIINKRITRGGRNQ